MKTEFAEKSWALPISDHLLGPNILFLSEDKLCPKVLCNKRVSLKSENVQKFQHNALQFSGCEFE